MCHYITTGEGIRLTKGIPLIKSLWELSVDNTKEYLKEDVWTHSVLTAIA